MIQGCWKKKTNWDWGTRDQEEGERTYCYCQAPCRSWSLQGSNFGWGNEVSALRTWMWAKNNWPYSITGVTSVINKVSSLIIVVFLTRTKTVEAARADGEKIRLIGAAEARAVEAVGR